MLLFATEGTELATSPLKMPLSRLCLVPLLLGAATTKAEVRFAEIGGERGILPYSMDQGWGGGVAAADFDDDGDVDLFVPNAGSIPDQLYRNLGDGRFEEIADAAGVASTARSRVALWLDYDGDQRLDLFVAGDCFFDPPESDCLDLSTHRLYRQVAAGVFVETTVAAGLDGDEVVHRGQHRGGLSAGDIDNDGDLDLFVTLWAGRAQLFANNGDGTFDDISATSGLGIEQDHHQPMMHDFDGDGWLDVYSNIDNTANRLWINQGDRTFVDMAPASGADNAWNDMGLTLGDVDNDGDLDVYITNIETLQTHNLLLRNDSAPGALHFTRLSDSGAESGGWGWGTTFLDVDKDGDLDLAATNGWPNGTFALDASRLFIHTGSEPITLVDAADSADFADLYLGSSLVAADLDRDGDLDLLQTCNDYDLQTSQVRLLDNRTDGASSGNYLVVRPRMEGANHRAVGAIVRIEIGGLRRLRLIAAGTSYLGQEPAEAFFGTGTATRVDRVTVDWPDGDRTVLADVAANQILVVRSPLLFADGFESGDTTAW